LLAEWGEDFTIRHLVMPNHVECCTCPVLDWIAEHVPWADSSGRRNIGFVGLHSHWSSASAGVFQLSAFRGLALRVAATAAIA
jgi:hypothetical protein